MWVKVACNRRECPLWGKKTEVPFEGKLDAAVVWIGEAPGKTEEDEGKPFKGRAGKLHKETMREVGLNYYNFFTMNAARCLIDKKRMLPADVRKTLACCRPKVETALKAIKPKAIVCLGDFAMRQVLRRSGIKKSRGRWIWSEEFECWMFPTLHPAYILRSPGEQEKLTNDYKQVKEFIDNGYELPKENDRSKGYREVENIRFILDLAKKKPLFASLDTESQGLNWLDPNFLTLSYSISYDHGKAVDVELYEETTKEKSDFTIIWPRKKEGEKKKVPTEVFVRRLPHFDRKLSELKEFLESPNIKKAMFHGNHDLHCIKRTFEDAKIKMQKVRGYVMDLQAAVHLYDENVYSYASLRDVQMGFTDIREDYDTALTQKWGKDDMLSIPKAERVQYTCSDADTTRRGAEKLAKFLSGKGKEKLLRYFSRMSMRAIPGTLFRLEDHGARIDMEALPKVKTDAEAEMDKFHSAAVALIPKRVREMPRHENKLGLTRDELVADTLFSENGYGLEPIRRTKTGYSVDKHVRRALLDPRGDSPEKVRKFLENYNQFSEYHTLRTRYLKGFEKHIRRDGRIHSSLSTVTVVTGRTSSRDPNMQNNPKRSPQAWRIRRLICATPGYLLLRVDMEQSELRWLAHISGDLNLIAVFASDGDIHVATALEISQTSEEAWKKLSDKQQEALRRSAKIVNFGVIYLMSPYGLARYAYNEYGVRITEEEADDWIQGLFRKYPGVPAYHRRIIEFGREHGYVESPLGRRRRLPELRSDDQRTREDAEGMAVNHPVQSPSSDGVLLADDELYRKHDPDPKQFRSVLFIHDEMVYEVKDNSKVVDYAKLVRQEMENPPLERDFGLKLRVPLRAGLSVGRNLAEMKELSL